MAKANAEGETSHLLDLVDQLATQLLAGRLSRPGEQFARMAALTTHSFPALKSFLEGESAFRAGRIAEAIEAYRRAVAADPDFAFAHYRLSYMFGGYTQHTEASRNAIAQAMRLKDRLPEHDRLELEAISDLFNGRIDTSERRLREIQAAYPDAWETWQYLGATLATQNPFRGRSVMEARDVLEHALSLDPERIDTAILICQLDEAEEKWAALSSSIGRYLTLDSRSDYATVMRTLQAFQFGDKASQERLVAELRRASDFALGAPHSFRCCTMRRPVTHSRG